MGMASTAQLGLSLTPGGTCSSPGWAHHLEQCRGLDTDRRALEPLGPLPTCPLRSALISSSLGPFSLPSQDRGHPLQAGAALNRCKDPGQSVAKGLTGRVSWEGGGRCRKQCWLKQEGEDPGGSRDLGPGALHYDHVTWEPALGLLALCTQWGGRPSHGLGLVQGSGVGGSVQGSGPRCLADEAPGQGLPLPRPSASREADFRTRCRLLWNVQPSPGPPWPGGGSTVPTQKLLSLPLPAPTSAPWGLQN